MSGSMEHQAELVRSMADSWSLAGDQALLQLLDTIHKNITEKATASKEHMDKMLVTLDSTSIALQNVNNRLMSLSNSQFIESRVYEDDTDVAVETNQQPQEIEKVDKPETSLDQMSKALSTLEQYYEEIRIVADSDSDSDIDEHTPEERIVLKAKDLYSERPLPYIIGSNNWKNKWHVGLVEEDTDSDSTVSAKEKEDEESFSSDSEVELTRTDPKHEESYTSSENTISEEDLRRTTEPVAPSVVENKLTPQAFAAELARRLGGDIPITPAPPILPATVSNATKKNKSLFSSTPPPLDVNDDVSDDDDLFYTGNQKEQTNSSYGGLFDDLYEDNRNKIVNKNSNNDNSKSKANNSRNNDLFNDNNKSRNHSNTTDDLFDDYENNKQNKNLISELSKQINKKNNNDSQNNTERDIFDDFADHNANNQNKSGNQQNKNNNNQNKDFGEDTGENKMKNQHNKDNKSNNNRQGLFDDFSDDDLFNKSKTNNQHTKGVEEEVEQRSSVKKPIGGISMFGSKSGAESIAAAIRGRMHRAPSDDGSDVSLDSDEKSSVNDNKNDKGLKYDTKNIQFNDRSDKKSISHDRKSIPGITEKSLTSNTHNKSVSKESNLLSNANSDKSIKGGDKKFKSLFDDDIFDDIDDLFTKVPKKILKNDKNAGKSTLFDDDDLFKDDSDTKSIKTYTKSLLDNDFDIKSKSIAETSIKHSTKSLFADDSDSSLLSDAKPKLNNTKSTEDNIKTPPKDETKPAAQASKLVSSDKNDVKNDVLNDGNDDDVIFKASSNIKSSNDTNSLNDSKSSSDTKSKKTLSIFDSDEEDELFAKKSNKVTSEIKATSSLFNDSDDDIFTMKKNIKPMSEELFKHEPKYDVIKSDTKTNDELFKSNTRTTNTNNDEPFSTKIIPHTEYGIFSDEASTVNDYKTTEKTSTNLNTNKISTVEEVNTIEKSIDGIESIENTIQKDQTAIKNVKIISQTLVSSIETDNEHKATEPITVEIAKDVFIADTETPQLVEKPLAREEKVLNEENVSTKKDIFYSTFNNEPPNINSTTEQDTEDSLFTQNQPNQVEKDIFFGKSEAKKDIFDSIFSELPPEFEDTTKHKNKLRNADCIFDDSDDELFLKPNIPEFEEKNSYFPTSIQNQRKFDVFLEEPPDDDLFAGNQNLQTEKDKRVTDTVKTNSEKKPVNPEKINQGDPNSQKDILTVETVKDGFEKSKATSQNIGNVANTKENVVANSENEKVTAEKAQVTIAKVEVTSENAKNVKDNNTVGTVITNIVREKVTVEKSKDIPEKVELKVDSTDGTSLDRVKTIGKLKPMNFNINVNTLLPGASPKKDSRKSLDDKTATEMNINVTQDHKTDDQSTKQDIDQTKVLAENINFKTESYKNNFTIGNRNDITTENNNFTTQNSNQDKSGLVKSVSFENDPENQVLCNQYTKERPRIPVKRRPSSRRARIEAARLSTVDLVENANISMDNNKDFVDYTASLPNSPNRFDKDTVKKDIFDSKSTENKFSEIENIIKSEQTTDTHENSDATSDLLDRQQTIESQKITTQKEINSESMIQPSLCEKSPSDTTVLSNVIPSSIHSKELSKTKLQSPSESLGSLSSVMPSSNSNTESKTMTESASTSLLSSETVIPSSSQSFVSSKSIKKPSLFGDADDSDDDLFGDKVKSGPIMHILKDTKIDTIHTYSDDEDLFSSKVVTSSGITVSSEVGTTSKMATSSKDVTAARGDTMSSMIATSSKDATLSKVTISSKSLFGDDSDDDLFTTSKISSSSEILRSEKKTKSSEQVFEDPLSFLNDD